MNLGLPELILILFVAVFTGLFLLIPAWFILKKAGFNPFLSLLVLLPLLNLALLYYVAFAPWPNLKQNET